MEDTNASERGMLLMSSLLWRNKPVTIPPIKHWKRHSDARRVQAVAPALSQAAGDLCTLLRVYGAHRPLLAADQPRL